MTRLAPQKGRIFRTGYGARDGCDSPSSAGVTGFVRIVHLREEIVDYGHGVFEQIATVAVDRRFSAVIKQLEPKQRRLSRRSVVRSASMRISWLPIEAIETDAPGVPSGGAEFEVSLCNSEFGPRRRERVAVYQISILKGASVQPMRCEQH
jgi:hypothetical protein